MKVFIKKFLIYILLFFVFIFCFFFVGESKPAPDIQWGVVFSQKHSQLLGLNWKKNYLAILDDLKVSNIRLVAYWDLIEKDQGIFDFSDLDWQIEEAQKNGVKILLVIGQRVPRWPECHIPAWAKELKQEEYKKALLRYLKKIVERYKEKTNIWAWQVENEPFFPFGLCPSPDRELLKKEIALVKELDPYKRPIIITESGEIPLWINAAKLGDIVGHSLYKKVWIKELGMYFTYPFSPVYYARKRWIIEKFFKKKVICTELQAEPWGPHLLYDISLKEQFRTMNLNQFRKMIQLAQNTGEDLIYLWGVEWWYWLKTNYNYPDLWEEAKKLWQQSV